jgi:transcriptional regulator with XRE-family HTH domain
MRATLTTMPTWETTNTRGRNRARRLVRRTGEQLRLARLEAGLSTRSVGRAVGISHTHVRRIELGLVASIDIDQLSRIAAAVGCELSVNVHAAGPPVRDKAHLALLARFAARLHRAIRWQTEVPIPIPGDLRSADAVANGHAFDATVEAETRLGDVQATERKLRAKQRDLGTTRAILLVADTRHNRTVIADVPDLRAQFPMGTRACLAALARGEDPGGDCLVIL